MANDTRGLDAQLEVILKWVDEMPEDALRRQYWGMTGEWFDEPEKTLREWFKRHFREATKLAKSMRRDE